MIEQLFPAGIAHYLIGGLAIGGAIGLLYLLTGLVGGMSTAFSSTLSYVSRLPHFRQEKLLASREWRLVYAAGLILGALIYVAAGRNLRHRCQAVASAGWRLPDRLRRASR